MVHSRLLLKGNQERSLLLDEPTVCHFSFYVKELHRNDVLFCVLIQAAKHWLGGVQHFHHWSQQNDSTLESIFEAPRESDGF
jgi:hypothetical protein